MVFLGIPGIIAGAGIGYLIGGRKALSAQDRIALGIILSLFGGLILALGVGTFIEVSTGAAIVSIIAFVGGCAFGLGINWASVQKSKKSNRHIVYETDDDEQFDREIEEALRGHA